jgi:hypothetical protein
MGFPEESNMKASKGLDFPFGAFLIFTQNLREGSECPLIQNNTLWTKEAQ